MGVQVYGWVSREVRCLYGCVDIWMGEQTGKIDVIAGDPGGCTQQPNGGPTIVLSCKIHPFSTKMYPVFAKTLIYPTHFLA